MSERAGEAQEATPETLAYIIGLAGTVIPAEVIATWTQAERDDALAWAAAERLSASDNEGVERVPQPLFVHRAAEVCASPAMAQVAVDSWITCKEMVRVPGLTGDPAESAIAGAQMAITGLIVLIRAGTRDWQTLAGKILGSRPGGIRSVDLFALLGKAAPSRREFEEWLTAGEEIGAFKAVFPDTWRLREQGA